jgi:hypothetical protein
LSDGTLFYEVKTAVAGRNLPIPQNGHLPDSGEKQGDFLFRKKGGN